MSTIKILAIAGAGRSGSTLIDKILGEEDQVNSVGELDHIWDSGIRQNSLCGCGQPFRQCTFWNDVFHEAFGGLSNIDAEAIMELKESVDRAIYIPYITKPWLRSKKYSDDIQQYKTILSSLYKAIHKVSGSEVIILDSSKSPAYFHILQGIPEIELNVAHLVRDSRAVVYSWKRKKEVTQLPSHQEYMRQYGTVWSALHWLGRNITAHLLKKASNSYTFFRYEDFVKNPSEVLTKLFSYICETKIELHHLNSGTADFSKTHAVLGNPIRLQSGSIKIREDVEWKRNLNLLDKFITTFLTFPLLLAYKYFK